MPDSFYDKKPSRLSFVDHYWQMTENAAGTYPLYATVKWGLVFSRLGDTTRVQLIGPRTTPTDAPFVKNEHFWGVAINADVNLSGFTKKDLLNQNIEIPVVDGSFTLGNTAIMLPTYETMEQFTEELIAKGILFAAPIAAISHRDKQRKVKRFTGLTPKQIEQAERVDHAIILMDETENLSVVAARAGFSDQAHMTRDFKRLVGYSPSHIKRYFTVRRS